MTTLHDDNNHYTAVMNFTQLPTARPSGQLNFAGNLWPAGAVNPGSPGAPSALARGRQMNREIVYAFNEARAMLTTGFSMASSACRGADPEATLMMRKWFGPRQQPPAGNDWWIGALRIIGHLQVRIARDINLYYRGDASLIGQPNDYPGGTGNLRQRDIEGYAESGAGDGDGNIGLCEDFFLRKTETGAFRTARKGRDSIGGCLVHELSHNYCETDDHDAVNGGDCYGEANCLQLASQRPRCAWYNADNIEYFCEDAHYGIVAARAAIQSGAVQAVTNIRTAHQQVVTTMTQNLQRPVSVAPQRGPSNNVTQLLNTHMQASAVARNPSLPVNTEATSSVAALRARFTQS